MKGKELLILLLMILVQIQCANNHNSNSQKGDSVDATNNIEQYLEEIISVNEIPGMALGVVKNGQLIYETYKGKASLETGERVHNNTLFRLYSTTKLITVVAIFKLIEEGKIQLNHPIEKYISNCPEQWQPIKIHHLIAHASGLPDIVQYDYKMSDEHILSALYTEDLDFEAGEKFSYNQTNYWFLTKIIEKITNLTYEDYILKNQFEEERKTVTFSSNHTDVIEGKAPLYWYQAEKKEYEKVNVDFGRRANSASGLNLSLRELVKWNKRLDENLLLNEKTKQLMWSSYKYKNKKDEFLYGWGVYDNNSIGFTGSGVTGLKKFLEDDVTIIFLSNGFKKQQPVHHEIIDGVAKLIL